jgi:hypothetical protein
MSIMKCLELFESAISIAPFQPIRSESGKDSLRTIMELRCTCGTWLAGPHSDDKHAPPDTPDFCARRGPCTTCVRPSIIAKRRHAARAIGLCDLPLRAIAA